MSRFYSIAVNDFRHKPVDLQAVAGGKVALVVNVASQCGFTPQYAGLQALYDKYKDQGFVILYAGLQALYDKYKDQGFVILGVPTNDFRQEPLDGEQVVETCQRNFGVTFPILEKTHVNGAEEHELYKFLKAEKPGILGFKMIKWNFEKFLIDRNGVPVERFASTTTPEKIESKIVELLAN
ncbi:hypothetical protein HK405_006181 [Cladochytrium tenue]|nr:hypothetical protein HK405_006181 [Cladochytrium tenue]